MNQLPKYFLTRLLEQIAIVQAAQKKGASHELSQSIEDLHKLTQSIGCIVQLAGLESAMQSATEDFEIEIFRQQLQK